ncbi:ABC-2 family transporter protein [bacterium]|nr:ABC-2 family transporter protein [bacterium]
MDSRPAAHAYRPPSPAHWLALCWHYALQRLKMDLAYRGDYLFAMFTSLLYTCLQLFFLWALFSRVPQVHGWTLEGMILLFGFSQVSFGWFSVGFFELVNQLSDYYILEGHLDRPLLRPAPPLLQLIMENLSLRELHIVVKGTAIVWWALGQLEQPVAMAPWVFLAMQGLGILGAVVYAGVFLAIASLSFWVKDRVGLVNPLFSVSEAARYPLTIYDHWVQVLFTVVVPFGFAAFYPALYFTEPESWRRWLLLGPLIAAVTMGFGILVFSGGLKRYESSGT